MPDLEAHLREAAPLLADLAKLRSLDPSNYEHAAGLIRGLVAALAKSHAANRQKGKVIRLEIVRPHNV